jgi:hypothetical protein
MTFHSKAPDWGSDVVTNFLFLSIIPAMIQICPFLYIKKQQNAERNTGLSVKGNSDICH